MIKQLLLVAIACAACASPPSHTGSGGGTSRPPPRDPCAVMKCAAGTRCVADGGNAQCVPADSIPSRDPCATMKCATGTHCVSPDDRPRCVADAPGGDGPEAAVSCKTDADCPRLACGPCGTGDTVLQRHVQIRCVRNPCPSAVAVCRANACVIR